MRKSGRFAWVEFASLAVSQQALALDGESLGAGVMKVSQSKTPIHTAGWRAAVCPIPCIAAMLSSLQACVSEDREGVSVQGPHPHSRLASRHMPRPSKVHAACQLAGWLASSKMPCPCRI